MALLTFDAPARSMKEYAGVEVQLRSFLSSEPTTGERTLLPLPFNRGKEPR